MHRSSQNPILTRHDVRVDTPELRNVSSVFNPGAIKLGEGVALLLRVQNRGRETFLIQAASDDGLRFQIASVPSIVNGLDALERTVYHIYDPRITAIGGQLFVTLAVDTDKGCRAVLAKTENLMQLDYVGQMWDGDARNAVLFPEKINGKYTGLVRPNPSTHGISSAGSEIWLIESPDLAVWNPVGPILAGRLHFWDELIGSGPPPVKTKEGWLHIYHGIATHFASVNIYQAGVCLLDKGDPSEVIARGKYNILEPRKDYELIGQVPNVVFPSGLIVDDYDSDGCAQLDSRVSLYYGAADTVVAVACTTIRELLSHCHAGNK